MGCIIKKKDRNKMKKIHNKILLIAAAFSIICIAGCGTKAEASETAFYTPYTSDQSSETVIRTETPESVTAPAEEAKTDEKPAEPTAAPTEREAAAPTQAPTAVPTARPTAVPTQAPSTPVPTQTPSTPVPTAVPTQTPSTVPTQAPTPAPHVHSYTGTVTTPATCVANGVKTYTCSCGSSYTEAVPATGHSYVQTWVVAATCATNGSVTYTCQNCGGVMQETVLATGQHTWVPVTPQVWVVDQPAWDETITDYIYEVHTLCNVCGLDFTAAGYTVDDLLDHDEAHALAFEGGGWHTEQVAIPVTTTLHHDETGHYETQTVGYVCGVCGAAQ